MKFAMSLILAALLCGCASVRSSSEVQAAIAPFIERGEIAGLVSVLSDPDGTLSVDCFGYADVENGRRMEMDTVFAVFSMTKTFTGCAIMVAVDKGILSLDDPVSQYLTGRTSDHKDLSRSDPGSLTYLHCRHTALLCQFLQIDHCIVPSLSEFHRIPLKQILCFSVS